MSWEATAYVLKIAGRTTKRELSSTHVLVLLALAGRHHRDICCAFGQYKKMAADTHLDDDTIVTAVNYLEAQEHIRVFFGPLPLKTRNGRPVMGNLYCFVGLDPDDGPDLEGVRPRRRLGGRPSDGSSARPNSLDPVGPEGELTGVAGGAVRSEGADQFGLTGATSSAEVSGLTGPVVVKPEVLKPESEDDRENIGKPVARSHGNSHRQSELIVDGDGAEPARPQDPPTPLVAPPRPEAIERQCPIAPHKFFGDYGAHLATDYRHQVRHEPPRSRPASAQDELVDVRNGSGGAGDD